MSLRNQVWRRGFSGELARTFDFSYERLFENKFSLNLYNEATQIKERPDKAKTVVYMNSDSLNRMQERQRALTTVVKENYKMSFSEKFVANFDETEFWKGGMG